MRKLSTLILVCLTATLLCSSVLYATCDPNIPEWKLTGTDCLIYPYYYKAEISAELDWFRDGGDPETGSASGSCIEYWQCINDNDCHQYSCEDGGIESSYSWEDDPNDLYVGLTCFECDCYHTSGYWWWPYPYYGDCNNTISGSWSDKIYTGSESWDCEGYDEWDNLIATDDYAASISITAEFNRTNIDANCLTDPVVTIKDYEETMWVIPEGGSCCPSSSTQTITLSCAGAHHIKTTYSSSGNGKLIKEVDYDEGCSNEVCGGGAGFITIVPHHGVELKKDEPKTATANYSINFYDRAGNEINSASVSVTLTVDCPPKPDRPPRRLSGINKYKNDGYAGHSGLLIHRIEDVDFGPDGINPFYTNGASPWGYGGPGEDADGNPVHVTRTPLAIANSGVLLAGPNKDKPCKCATRSDVQACVRDVSEQWDGTTYSFPARACHSFVGDAMSKCCLKEFSN